MLVDFFGNIEAAQDIYHKAIKLAFGKQNWKLLSLLYINFAQFTFVVTGIVDAAKDVFIKGIQQNPSKKIMKGFLNFITIHGGTAHIDSVGLVVAAFLCPESDVSQASHSDCEEISQLYLKFVDLYGTIYQIRQAWDGHRKLFPHFLRQSSVCDTSSLGLQIQSKKIDKVEDLKSLSPNSLTENHSKNAKNHFPVNIPIIISEETPNFELKSAQFDNEKDCQQSMPAEATNINDLPFSGEKQGDILIKPVNESQKDEILAASISHGNLEPPTLDNLSISSTDLAARQVNTINFHNNSDSHKAVSVEDGNKFDGKGSAVHTENNLKCIFKSQEKLQEDSRLSHSDSQATPKKIEDEQLQLHEKMNASPSLPVNNAQYIAYGGHMLQFSSGVQGLANPNSMLHGYLQSLQQWQAHIHMQYQSGKTKQQMPLTQNYIYQSPTLPYSQDSQASHTQLLYQITASQAYNNPGQTSVQQAYHTQAQVYQNATHSAEQYGYQENSQGFSPHLWQYYQNLYLLQLHNQHMNISFLKQQSSASQHELQENQDVQGQINLDEELNAAGPCQNMQEKPDESTQINMNLNHSQLLYMQQQQQFNLQQQQQQFNLQQQQQHKQLLLFQQQQLLQLQLWQKQVEQQRAALPLPQEQPQYPPQQQQQQEFQPQPPINLL